MLGLSKSEPEPTGAMEETTPPLPAAWALDRDLWQTAGVHWSSTSEEEVAEDPVEKTGSITSVARNMAVGQPD